MGPRRTRSTRRRVEAAIDIDAPVEAVWKALTDAEELSRWFPIRARVAPGVGGSIWISWGPPYEGTSSIEIWEPGRRLRLIDQGFGNSDVVGAAREAGGAGTAAAGSAAPIPGSSAGREPAAPPPSPVALDYLLEGRGNKTTLRLVHAGFGDGNEWDEEFDSVRRGWRFELRGLRHYLERHRGTPRLAIWPRLPLPAGCSVMQAWERLVSRDGLLREGALAGVREGNRYEVRTAAGDSLRGTVSINEPPDFAGTVENLNDAFFRVHIESNRGVREVGLWMSTYGVPPEQVQAIEAGWAEMLRGLFARTR
jgi:uncharacterized protein YndB with AHSA1/START domain